MQLSCVQIVGNQLNGRLSEGTGSHACQKQENSTNAKGGSKVATKKTVKFMDWWVDHQLPLRLCSRETYRKVWDRRWDAADESLSADIAIMENRVLWLKRMQHDIRTIKRGKR